MLQRSIYIRFLLLSLLGFGLSTQVLGHNQEGIEGRLVPQPSSIVAKNGEFLFSKETIIAVENEEQRIIAENFASLFTSTAMFTPQVKETLDGHIYFVEEVQLTKGAYVLDIDSNKIKIKASTASGFFYGLQSIRLLLPPAIESGNRANMKWSIPAATIVDQPRFDYRGFMLDVSRFFLPKEELLRMIDCIAMLKINILHLHLSDDNGWRLEIKKYPQLTEVGAWRVDRGALNFSKRRNQQENEDTPIGGFYTQEDMKEIIQYATERHVEIIPEIDMPAHSNAALTAYPEYACPVVKNKVTVQPGMGEDNIDIIFCAGNDKTYTFLQDILDEVIAIFPSKYVHLGGDEAIKTYWKKCPLCQNRMHEEHLSSEEDLQGYFMNKMSAYVQSKDKTIIGWDELTNSEIPNNAIIMGWQGYGQAALKAAAEGHRFIMTPARIAYLIRYQGPQWYEPFTYFGHNTLKDLHDYEPIQKEWAPEYEKLMIGVQASLWTEFCSKPEDVFYLAFPRLAALAEIAWAKKGYKDWDAFLKGMDNYNAHIAQKGVKYARSMYNIQHRITPADECLQVELECIRTDVEIRYTMDNTDPSFKSALYKGPLTVTKNMLIKAATFINDRQVGQTLTLPINWNLATSKQIIDSQKGQNVLVNGLRGSLKHTDFEWYPLPSDSTTIIIDLKNKKKIQQVTIGNITNNGMTIHKPRSIILETSIDNKTFKKVGELHFSDDQIFKDGTFIENLTFDIYTTMARYIRVNITKPGICPVGSVRAGHESKVYIDQIIIK